MQRDPVEKIPLSEIKFDFVNGEKKKIGKGGFSNVFKAKWRNLDVAVKLMAWCDIKNFPNVDSQQIESINEDYKKSFIKEIKAFLTVKSEHIAKFYGYSIDEKGRYLVISKYYQNGSLHSLLENVRNGVKTLSDDEKCQMCKDLILGVKTLHDANFVHRDIKTMNILVDDDGSLKICDFGNTRNLISMKLGHTCQLVGTPNYYPPELLKENNPEVEYDKRSDVYCVGLVLSAIITGKEPPTGMYELFKLKFKNVFIQKLVAKIRRCVNEIQSERPSLGIILSEFEKDSQISAEMFKREAIMRKLDIERRIMHSHAVMKMKGKKAKRK